MSITSDAFCTSVWNRASLRRVWMISVIASRSRASSTCAASISMEFLNSTGTLVALEMVMKPCSLSCDTSAHTSSSNGDCRETVPLNVDLSSTR